MYYFHDFGTAFCLNIFAAFLKSAAFFPHQQHGFRRGLSTTALLVEVTHYFSQVIDATGQVDITFLDFVKAFDLISHNKLLFKVQKVHNNTQITNRLETYLKDRIQYVENYGPQYHQGSIESGVPQGSVFGPLLFLIYIYGIALEALVQLLTLFAEDCILFTEIKQLYDQLQPNNS